MLESVLEPMWTTAKDNFEKLPYPVFDETEISTEGGQEEMVVNDVEKAFKN